MGRSEPKGGIAAFAWNFTRDTLAALIDRLDQATEAPPLPLAA